MRYHIFEYPDDQDPWLRPAIDMFAFPWEKMVPGLMRQVGRDYIPVQLSDLSRYSARGHGTHTHVPGDRDVAHPIQHRSRVLGLYWLSVKVEVEQSLKGQPLLLAEVLGAELGHGVDYAMLTEFDQISIAAALHPNGPDEHTWWEVKDYQEEYNRLLGETFMEVFCRAYAPDLPITMLLDHPVTAKAIQLTREILTPELVAPAPPITPVEPAPVEPEPAPLPPGGGDSGPGSSPFFAIVGSTVVHDSHMWKGGKTKKVYYDRLSDAIDAGLRPCRVCKPKEG